MTEFPLAFDKLLIYDPDKSSSTCHVFISHQSPAEEKSLGKLFVLTEISSRDKININIINTIQEELKLSYYNTDDLNIETAFEKALERANQRIADMVGDYDTNWLDKLNVAAAVLKQDNLYVSTIGKIHTFLVRHEKIINVQDSAAGDVTPYERVNPLKAFSTIVSGTLQAGDTLLFCTTSLLDYLSLEKLKKTVSDRPLPQAVESIESILLENVANTAFAAIIVTVAPATAVEERQRLAGVTPAPAHAGAAAPVDYTTPQSSMEALLQKQTATGKILTPSLSRYLFEFLQNTSAKLADFIKVKVLRQSPRRVRLSKTLHDYHAAYPQKAEQEPRRRLIIAPLYGGLRRALTALAGGIRKFFLLFSPRKEKIAQQSVSDSTSTTLSQRTSQMIIAIKRLPRVSKIFLGLALVIAFLLAQSLFSSALSEHKKQQSVEYEKTVSAIAQKTSKAEATLSYGNEEGAKKLLAEAEELLKTLPDKSREEKEKIQELSSGITAQREKMRHAVATTPQAVVTFTAGETKVNAKDLALLNKTVYTFDPAQKTIYAAEIGSEQTNSWPFPEQKNTFQYIVPQNTRSLVFLNTANALDEFDVTTKKLKSLTFTPPAGEVNVASVAMYESKLYLLDINNNQIYRANKIAAGYTSPLPWIKDSTDVRQAQSMAVDGYIYVLMSNGEVIRLFQGAKQEWSLATVDPVLDHADKIWTDADTDNLYILDKKGKRIVAFTKEGKLVNQYLITSLNTIKDFTVDFANKKMYLLDGNTVFSVDI